MGRYGYFFAPSHSTYIVTKPDVTPNPGGLSRFSLLTADFWTGVNYSHTKRCTSNSSRFYFRSYLTDGEYGHSGSYSVFLYDAVGRHASDDHTDTTDQESDDEKRPAEVLARENVTVKQVGVVRETESTCQNTTVRVITRVFFFFKKRKLDALQYHQREERIFGKNDQAYGR